MATHVHDMHLGDGPQHSGSEAVAAAAAAAPDAQGDGAAAAAAAAAAAPAAEQQAATQQAGAAAQTYAQATGRSAGAGGSGGAQQAGQLQPHLAFYMGGRLLQPGSTIFQAVQQQLLAEAATGGGGGNANGANGGASGLAAQPGTGTGGGDLGSRLWGQVHTITYRSWGAAMRLQEAEAATSVMSPRAAAGAAGGFGSSGDGEEAPESGPHDHEDASASPLSELLASALPADIQASQVGGRAVQLARGLLSVLGKLCKIRVQGTRCWRREVCRGSPIVASLQHSPPPTLKTHSLLSSHVQDALDALSVLRITEALNRLSPHLAAWLEGRSGRVHAAGSPPLGCLPRDAFLSSKLGPKLNQQLKDVLSICGGEWPVGCLC